MPKPKVTRALRPQPTSFKYTDGWHSAYDVIVGTLVVGTVRRSGDGWFYAQRPNGTRIVRADYNDPKSAAARLCKDQGV